MMRPRLPPENKFFKKIEKKKRRKKEEGLGKRKEKRTNVGVRHEFQAATSSTPHWQLRISLLSLSFVLFFEF